MAIEEVGVVEVRRLLADTAGVSPEALTFRDAAFGAEFVRHAASLVCPTTRDHLIDATVSALVDVLGPEDVSDELVGDAVDTLVRHGDLLELQDPDDATSHAKLLFLAPPTFITRRTGQVLLLGVRPDGMPLLGPELQSRLESRAHVRHMDGGSAGEIPKRLLAEGLRPISDQVWLRAPASLTAHEYRRPYDEALERAGPSGELRGLTILTREAQQQTYYKGRWREPSGRVTDRYLGRRLRDYGSAIWCYVELVAGRPTRAIDLGDLAADQLLISDDATRLAAALDATAGHAQLLRTQRGESDATIIEVFAPIPSWMQRRWDAIGSRATSRGALIAYAIPTREVAEEVSYATRMLWLRTEEGRGR